MNNGNATDASKVEASECKPVKGVEFAYEATYNFHNTLVQIRFVSFGLYFTAVSFLLNTIYGSSATLGSKAFMAVFGMLLAIAGWLLDKRTMQLLITLIDRGLMQEKALEIQIGNSFFQMLQPRGLRRLSDAFTSHSSVFGAIYWGSGLGWLILFVWHLALICA